AAKGLTMKYTMGKISHSALPLASKGMLIGLSSRALDTGLNRDSYIDKSTGQVDVAGGLLKSGQSALSGGLLFDAGAFCVGGALAKRMDLPNNPLVTSMATGAAFGWSSGVSAELNRQMRKGKFDISMALHEGTIHAVIDSLAAAPGGMI